MIINTLRKGNPRRWKISVGTWLRKATVEFVSYNNYAFGGGRRHLI